MVRTLALIFGLFLLPLLTAPVVAAEATVFVAASLTDVIEELVDGFAAETGRDIAVVPGSSSTLAQQIMAGAPADAFISANRLYADEVAKSLHVKSRDLFGNSLAIIAPDDFDGTVSLKDLVSELGDGRLAVGDPAHVPAGIYAREALENAGLWAALSDHLAPASDVRAAVAFVASGAAPLGIVYKTDANVDGVKLVGEIDPALHSPIRYWDVTINPDNEVMDMFFSYLGSMKGENLIDYLGFDVGRDFDFLNEPVADE